VYPLFSPKKDQLPLMTPESMASVPQVFIHSSGPIKSVLTFWKSCSLLGGIHKNEAEPRPTGKGQKARSNAAQWLFWRKPPHSRFRSGAGASFLFSQERCVLSLLCLPTKDNLSLHHGV